MMFEHSKRAHAWGRRRGRAGGGDAGEGAGERYLRWADSIEAATCCLGAATATPTNVSYAPTSTARTGAAARSQVRIPHLIHTVIPYGSAEASKHGSDLPCEWSNAEAISSSQLRAGGGRKAAAARKRGAGGVSARDSAVDHIPRGRLTDDGERPVIRSPPAPIPPRTAGPVRWQTGSWRDCARCVCDDVWHIPGGGHIPAREVMARREVEAGGPVRVRGCRTGWHRSPRCRCHRTPCPLRMMRRSFSCGCTRTIKLKDLGREGLGLAGRWVGRARQGD